MLKYYILCFLQGLFGLQHLIFFPKCGGNSYRGINQFYCIFCISSSEVLLQLLLTLRKALRATRTFKKSKW